MSNFLILIKRIYKKKKNPAPNILFTDNLKLVGQVKQEKRVLLFTLLFNIVSEIQLSSEKISVIKNIKYQNYNLQMIYLFTQKTLKEPTDKL